MPRDHRDVRRRSRSRSVDKKKRRERDTRRSRSRSNEGRRRRSRSRSYENRRRRSRSRSHERKKSRRSRSPKRDIKKEMDSIPMKERKRLLSISSTSSEDERGFDERVESLRKEKAERRKIDRRRMKELETPEEKRIRRLAKKLKKEEGRKVETLSSAIAYNNLNNPFNDPNLTNPFVWKKKMDTEGVKPHTKQELDELHFQKVKKNVREMEELRRNRISRQEAKEELERSNREREKELSGDYSVIERKFHIKQAKERTKIRIRENRAKPIDLLARYSVFGIPKEEEQYGDFELVDPIQYIKDLTVNDYKDLIADIRIYKTIADHKDDDFWDDMETICNNELSKLENFRERKEINEAIHSSVRDEIINRFKGKTYDQLNVLKTNMKKKVEEERNQFYEATLFELLPFMARLRIKDRHREKMALKLKRIKKEQAKEMDEYHKQLGDVKPPIFTKVDERKVVNEDMEITEEDAVAMQKEMMKSIEFTLDELLQLPDEQQEQRWSSLNEHQLKIFTERNYELGRYSPVLDDTAMPGIEIIDEADASRQLEAMRNPDTSNDNNPMTSEEARMMQAFGGIEKDEENFNEEVTQKQTYLWSDKYRPRKPRYLNRVHTGFDWNKYNQTHYDLDNPPPKVVQGYRFNIFYPDLLDVTQTPEYTLTECDDPDFAILRFTAGPPYEDIAFKIVNREWEINHKHGFKNQFKDGVFQLWFFFKRYRYRR